MTIYGQVEIFGRPQGDHTVIPEGESRTLSNAGAQAYKQQRPFFVQKEVLEVVDSDTVNIHMIETHYAKDPKSAENGSQTTDTRELSREAINEEKLIVSGPGSGLLKKLHYVWLPDNH